MAVLARAGLSHGLPDPLLRRLLAHRREAVVNGAGAHALVLSDPQALETATGIHDSIVSFLVLCRVPDLDAALERLRALLGSSGRLHFLEHTAATGAAGIVQRRVAPLWHGAGGCHVGRSVTHSLREAGFVIDHLERFDPVWGKTRQSTWVQGEAYPR